jgi:hypothetical protein
MSIFDLARQYVDDIRRSGSVPAEPTEVTGGIGLDSIGGTSQSGANVVDQANEALRVTVTATTTGPVTIADGADVCEGSTTDVAVVSDANGTLSAKLRGLVKMLASVWDSGNNRLNVAITAALPAGTALLGKVGIDQTTPGTSNGVQVNAALPAGANAIGKLAANDAVDIGDVTINNAAGAAAVNIQDGGNSITVDGTVGTTVADGANVALGTTTDAAVIGDTAGTVEAKLRGANTSLEAARLQQARLTVAQMSLQQSIFQAQPQGGFVPQPELPAFLGGF